MNNSLYRRYLAQHEGTEQGFITLIPFLESLDLSDEDRVILQGISDYFDDTLPFPRDTDGTSIYTNHKVTESWFTAKGQKEFEADIDKLKRLIETYLEPFDYLTDSGASPEVFAANIYNLCTRGRFN